ncbi:MAG: PqiC family protein [Candidatus Omnitrophica bacterium]|nr:PqiC family protein [Candidatus Omnitrophota bacterium]MDD3987981.1 PqiC family protein [Candidatus Omnitrophota bacterium]MDD4981683.1 PqiC family protein [Candidatus Omnitrophota bacterium]
MKKVSFYFILLPSLILILNGCVSIGRSPSPRFYRLTSIGQEFPEVDSKMKSGAVVGIGPIKIPEYLNRPQIATVNKNRMITFAQFDRWGEPLDLSILRVLSENLASSMTGVDIEMYPWNMLMPVRLQVVLDVVQIDVELEKDLIFVVRWSVLDLKNKSLVLSKRTVLKEPVKPSNYSGVAAALSSVLGRLGNEIIQELSQVPTQDK